MTSTSSEGRDSTQIELEIAQYSIWGKQRFISNNIILQMLNNTVS